MTTVTNALPKSSQRFITQISQIAHDQNIKLYIVGGIVRDFLIGCHSTDIDLLVSGDAIMLAQSIVKQLGGSMIPHERFRTATWQASPDSITIDLITARSESYAYRAALPSITKGTINDDLARRDFTINTLAWDIENDQLVDLYNGQIDLQNRVIRCLHEQSFIDDPTRIFRAIRYAQRLDFIIEQQTNEWLNDGVTGITNLSGDRIRHELSHILQESNTASMLLQLNDIGALSTISHHLEWDMSWATSSFSQKGHMAGAIKWRLWLAQLPAWETIANHLNLPHALCKDVTAIIAIQTKLPLLKQPPPSIIEQTLRPYKQQPLARMVAQEVANDEIATYLKQYDLLKDISPLINGNDLKQAGIPPSSRYRYLLDTAIAHQLDGKIDSVSAALTLVCHL